MDFNKLLQKHVAEAIGVTYKTVGRWTTAGMPRNSDKTYSLPKCIEWLLDRQTEHQSPEDLESDRWLGEYRKERAMIAKIERKRLEEKLVPKQEILKAWSQRTSEIKSGLLALQHRLPPLLEARSQNEIMTIVADEVWNLLDNYNRHGQFTPKGKFNHDKIGQKSV